MTITTERDGAVRLDLLADQLQGDLHRPGDAGYARLATPWHVAVAVRPLAVVEAADAQDVQRAVRFAAEAGIGVEVRCTGHGAVSDGAGSILVHTGRLDGLEIRPDGVARIGAGLRWSRVIEAAAPLGLTPVCGSAPNVGVVGMLTGGGIGPLARSLGLAADRVRAFEVVTGDGELRHVSATENRALFWALRGGKGALGVVTAVEIELVPLTGIVGGCLFFGASDVDRMLPRWAAWAAALPEQGTTSAAIMRLPEMPGVPEPLAGKVVLAVRFGWTGGVEPALAAVASLTAEADPVLGGVGPMPAAAVGAIHDDPVDPIPVVERSTTLRAIDAGLADALIAVAGAGRASRAFIVELRQLGGRVRTAPAVPDAFDHRDAAGVLSVIAVLAGPGSSAAVAEADAILDAAGPWSTGMALPNFAPGDDAAAASRLWAPGTAARLASLSDAFDPRGVLRAAAAVRRAAGLPLL